MNLKFKLLQAIVLSAIVCSCTEKEPTSIPVSSIALNPTTLTITEGETATITATVSPNNADNKKIRWSSSDASVASVFDGKVSAIAAGSADIVAVAEDNGIKATCHVTVQTKPTTNTDGLHISISNITDTSCRIAVTTSSDKTFHWDTIEKETWNNSGGQAVWDSFISYYSENGSLDKMIVTGSDSFDYTGLTPQTEYIVFASFCDNKGNRSGEFYTKTFTTAKGESDTNDGLHISISNITDSGCQVEISTTSTKTYHWDTIDKATWDQYGGQAVWDSFISYYSENGTLSQLIFTGNDRFEYTELDPQTEYIVFASFCDYKGQRSGEFYTKTFTTAKGSESDVNSLLIKPLDSNSITQTTAVIEAELKTAKGTTVVERGFKYYDYWEPVKSVTTVKIPGTEGSYRTTLSNLAPYGTYYVKAYAILRNSSTSEQQEVETVEVKVKLLKGPARLYMKEVWSVSCTSANLIGLRTHKGGESSGEGGGFVISTSPNPTISTPNVIKLTDYSTVDYEEYGFKVTNLKPNTKYYVRTFYINDVCDSYSEQVAFTTYPVPDGAVDLGLPSGLLWSDHNLGGKKPEDFGGYYAWGETKEKTSYTYSTSAAWNKKLTMISDVSPYVLLPQYDAATANWGRGWRMPTNKEFSELNSKCQKAYVERQNDYGQTISGIEFTGPNGNSIFLPAAGHKEATVFKPLLTGYWIPQCDLTNNANIGHCIMFSDSKVIDFHSDFMYYGFQIRPVI